MSVHMYTLADERSVLLLGLCATRGMAACEDEAGNLGHGGQREKFYSGASASEDNSKVFCSLR